MPKYRGLMERRYYNIYNDLLQPGNRAHSAINVRWRKVLICEIYIRVVKRLWIMSADSPAAYLRGEGRPVKSGNVVNFPACRGVRWGIRIKIIYYII